MGHPPHKRKVSETSLEAQPAHTPAKRALSDFSAQSSLDLMSLLPKSAPTTATATAPAPSPSPFLRLSKDIRRRIYELLPVRTKYVTGYRGESDDKKFKGKPVVILVLRYIERSIVQVCRQLSVEAEPVLEIETMKLFPPRLIVAAEYFHRLPSDMNFFRKHQDDYFWPRLRLQDKDRKHFSGRDLCLNGQRVVIWSRILHLNLLSQKMIRIGISYIGQSDQHLEKEWYGIEDEIKDSAKRIVKQKWWEDRCKMDRPCYEVGVECEKLATADSFTQVLIDEGMMAWRVVDPIAGFLERNFGVRSFRDLFLVDETLWKDVVMWK